MLRGLCLRSCIHSTTILRSTLLLSLAPAFRGMCSEQLAIEHCMEGSSVAFSYVLVAQPTLYALASFIYRYICTSFFFFMRDSVYMASVLLLENLEERALRDVFFPFIRSPLEISLPWPPTMLRAWKGFHEWILYDFFRKIFWKMFCLTFDLVTDVQYSRINSIMFLLPFSYFYNVFASK